jgi:uncharacterized membrane protein YphA (DoxX/SURF4 family)
MMSLEKISSFAPLSLRIVGGIVFIMHGLSKFNNFHETQGFFGSVGLPPDLVLPIILLEIIGGIALILGILKNNFDLVCNRNDVYNIWYEVFTWFFWTWRF